MKRRALKPWHGIVFFILIMAAFFFICVPMQAYWEMYGLAATELLILVMALIFTKVMGYPLKVLFPVKKPEFLPILGTCIIWGSTYLLDMVIMLIQYRLFPIQMEQLNSGLNEVMFSVPVFVTILVVSIMPAICEEAVHRGVIIHTLYSVRKEWLVVLIMGIYFGLFHSDPLRFLPTAILGAAISYIMLETENMVYPSFFHCINNLFPILLQVFLYGSLQNSIMQEAQQVGEQMIRNNTEIQIPLVSIGIYMIFAAASPFGLYLGNYLLHHKKGMKRTFIPRRNGWKTILGILLPTVLLFGTGMMIIIYGILFDPVMKHMLQNSINQFSVGSFIFVR
ncbi:MAG: type II CAAX endopeptidase family protein [Oliverpabstia sp.]|nr:CPBP family intramembrane metalloprotease [Lachnospiraceae bacterium]MDY5027376.1 type II CAAX endopeptidase family protein [Oliverpabstia sp.]